MRGEVRSTRRKICSSATLMTIKFTWNDVGFNPDLRGESLSTNRLCHGTALIGISYPSQQYMYMCVCVRVCVISILTCQWRDNASIKLTELWMLFRVIINLHYANHTNYKFTVWAKYRELMLNLVVHIATNALLNYVTDKSIMEKVPCKYSLYISINQECVRYGNSKSFDSIPSIALQSLLGPGPP